MRSGEIAQFRRLIEDAERIVALTGAGISTSAGIPDFRSPNTGLWHVFSDMDAFSSTGFLQRPHKLYQMILALAPSMGEIEPTLAHRWLAWLEEQGKLIGTVTQNVDGLHQLAGARHVVELHGNFRTAHCVGCGEGADFEELVGAMEGYPDEVPTCELCGGVYKPDVILFGDLLPPEALDTATQWATSCDAMLVLGSSLLVAPANSVPSMATRSGAKMAIINLEPTPLDGYAEIVLHEKLDEMVGTIWEGRS